MYNRLLAFINYNNLLYKYQFGFRKGYSTNMALIVLMDKILNAIDNGEVVLGVFWTLARHFLLSTMIFYFPNCTNMGFDQLL